MRAQGEKQRKLLTMEIYKNTLSIAYVRENSSWGIDTTNLPYRSEIDLDYDIDSCLFFDDML